MSLESMLENLKRDADLEIKKIQEEAHHGINEIKKETDQRSAQVRSEILTRAKESMDMEEAKEISGARTQANRLILESRRMQFDHVSSIVRECLRRLTKDPDYPQALLGLIQEALMGTSGKVFAEVAPSDVRVAEEALKRQNRECEIKGNPRISGGVVIRTLDHGLLIDNTIDNRLQKAMQSLTTEISQKLWPLAQ